MVEAIGKLKQFGPPITKAKETSIFLYAHHVTFDEAAYKMMTHCLAGSD